MRRTIPAVGIRTALVIGLFGAVTPARSQDPYRGHDSYRGQDSYRDARVNDLGQASNDLADAARRLRAEAEAGAERSGRRDHWMWHALDAVRTLENTTVELR